MLCLNQRPFKRRATGMSVNCSPVYNGPKFSFSPSIRRVWSQMCLSISHSVTEACLHQFHWEFQQKQEESLRVSAVVICFYPLAFRGPSGVSIGWRENAVTLLWFRFAAWNLHSTYILHTLHFTAIVLITELQLIYYRANWKIISGLFCKITSDSRSIRQCLSANRRLSACHFPCQLTLLEENLGPALEAAATDRLPPNNGKL